MISGLLLDLFVKPGLVVGAAAVIAGVLRNRSAAARHAVWSGAVLGVLALPLLEQVVPRMPLPMTVSSDRAMPSGVRLISEPDQLTIREIGPADAPPPVERQTSRVLLVAALSLWVAGVMVLAVRRLCAGVALRRLTGWPVRAPWLEALALQIAVALRVRRPVRLVLTPRIEVPGTAGCFRPRILLPLQALDWSPQNARAVLTHELSHVSRGDCLFNLLGDLAAIAYWCNPLVLLAVRRMRTEAERACDDVTVAGGTEPDHLADLLLSLARAATRADPLPPAVTALARPRELETRVLALLDSSTPRSRLRSGLAAALAGFGMLAALPAAALSLDEPSPTFQQPLGPEPDRVSDSVTAPGSERVRPRPATMPPLNALAGPDSLLARRLLEAARMAPRHAFDLVPDRAAWALAQERGGRLIDPLIDALASRDWRITAYAAWSLGISRAPRAVPSLLPLMDHPVWRVRAMTAFALQEIADPRAQMVMDRALTDPAWQVRSEAVRYFAAVGGAGLAERLRPRLTDRHIAVRLAAEQALAPH